MLLGLLDTLSERHNRITPENSHQSCTRAPYWSLCFDGLNCVFRARRPRAAPGNGNHERISAEYRPAYPLVDPNALYEHALHRDRIPDFSMRISTSCSSIFPAGSGNRFTENTVVIPGPTTCVRIIRRTASEATRRALLRSTAAGATFAEIVTLYRVAVDEASFRTRTERCSEEKGRIERKIRANSCVPRILFFAGIAIRGTENRPDDTPGRFLYGKFRPSLTPPSCDYFSS